MSEPENYVKKEEPRVSIKQRRKKSIGGTLGTLFAENQSMLMLFAAIVAALAVILTGIIALHMPGRSSLPDRIIRDWNCLLPA